jgi:hypothetical protein
MEFTLTDSGDSRRFLLLDAGQDNDNVEFLEMAWTSSTTGTQKLIMSKNNYVTLIQNMSTFSVFI